ncbi:Putative general negative regulator of transcription C16C9.04c [Termitomyces sp. J132]|nr:Putative general negative regulator of transcription C16C9.04c [Termitomyces sp. J132]
MDISDLNFKPCICGYQICRFCWHHIKENLNKRCPACRRVYTDEAVEFKPIATQDHKRLTQQKKQRERERKELENLNRRHLANVRVVQRNVVYVVGIGPRFAKEELIPTLRSNEYFGQYGKITKIILVKRTPSGGGDPVVGLYITYHRREDAARAITAVDGAPSTGGARGDVMRASYGTTKYCMAFLRNVSCSDHSCMNLHEWGDEKDCFTKEDLTTLKHTMKTTESRIRSAVVAHKKAGLPRAASWAQKQANVHTSNITSNNSTSGSANRQPRRGAAARQPRNPPSNDIRATAAVARSSHPDAKTVIGGKTGAQASSRPTTPSSLVPRRVTSPDVKDAGIKLKKESGPPPPPHSPDPLTQTEEPESGPPSVASPSPVPRTDSADSGPRMLPPSFPAVPPGLSVPPGIAVPSRPPQSSVDMALPETPLLASQSSYQMSTAARALLDDVKARREAALPTMIGVSPFPDFDRTLRTLSGGDGVGFSFNLDPNLAGNDLDHLSSMPDFEVEANVPFNGSYIDAFPGLRSPTAQTASFVAPPGLPYPHSTRSAYDPNPTRSSSTVDSQASGLGYMGSFNPFADTNEEAPGASVSSLGQSQYSLLDDDSSRKVSRFGFARGKQSSTATSSPLHVASPLSNSNGDHQPFYSPADTLAQGHGRAQWSANGRDSGFAQTSNTNSPLFQHALDHSHSQNRSQSQTFEAGLSEAQLRDFIQSSRNRAQSNLEYPPGLKVNASPFQDPAIMSARLANTQDSGSNQMSYGPPPGLSFPQLGTTVGLGVNIDGNGSAHASPSLSLALSSVDFPALTASPVEASPREEPVVTEDAAVQLDPKAQEKAARKAAKKAAAAEKAAERQRIAQEKAAIKAAERAKLVLERQLEKEKALLEKEKARAIKAQEKAAKDRADREKAAKARAENERLAKEKAIQAEKERQREKDAQAKKKQSEDKRSQQSSKSLRQHSAPKVDIVSAPPEAQVPLLSKKPKKNKPTTKPVKAFKEEGPNVEDGTTIPSISDLHLVATDTSTNNSRSHSLDRHSPTSIETLLEDIDISNPAMDLPNHPFFDTHRLSPAATVPLEYGPLVHALSALSVGGGSFANHMPSGSIDNAVSSFQQLLETLTQTISDLLRLLPRTTWDDSSSFDGVLRDMLKGDDFLDDGGDDGHGKEDEVAALTLALERRARWMEVQLTKLEELHRDINTAAVKAVLSFNDSGWDRCAFLPRVGDTLRRFECIGKQVDGNPMTAIQLEKELVVAKEMTAARETEVREVMERIQAIRPVGEF